MAPFMQHDAAIFAIFFFQLFFFSFQHSLFFFVLPFAGRQADKADGPEDKTFTSPLQAVMFSGKMEGRFRLFIARTKASNRCVRHQQDTARLFNRWLVGELLSVFSFCAHLPSHYFLNTPPPAAAAGPTRPDLAPRCPHLAAQASLSGGERR